MRNPAAGVVDGGVDGPTGAGHRRGAGHGPRDAEALLDAGATVLLADVAGDAARATAAELGDAARAVALDVAEESAWAAAREAVESDGPLDILICAAGVPAAGGARDVSLADWDRAQNVNCRGTLLGARAFLPGMADRGRGVMIGIGSVMTQRANPQRVAYCVSKAGLQMLIRCLALEFAGDGVRVCGVNPGWVATPGEQELRREEEGWEPRAAGRVPTGRLQTAREVGDACAFLCSEAAASITGVWLNVDGGLGTR